MPFSRILIPFRASVAVFNFTIKYPIDSSRIQLSFASTAWVSLVLCLLTLVIPRDIRNDVNVEVSAHMLPICHSSLLHLEAI